MDKILATGLSGMVGSRIVELLSGRYEFEDLSSQGVDIRDREKLREKVGRSKAKIFLHLAAKADVDDCEKDKVLGKKGEAWQINVSGTKNVVDACQEFGKKIIYISTDFVFDGKKSPLEGYSEKDAPSPINWYGQTKYEGEKIVERAKIPFLILRLAFCFRSFFKKKQDFVRNFLEQFKRKEKIKAVSDQIFTPTFIDDIAYGVSALIKKGASGIYHLVGSQSLTPYKASLQIASQFGFDPNLVRSVKMNKFYKGRAPRPKNLAIKNEKIKKLGIKMRSFGEGLKEMKRQMEESV